MNAALLAAGAGLLALAGPAGATVKDGVDAWSRGDYAAAVAQWKQPAEAGDADAQFNMAQAYRLGRGVTADEAKARDYYKKAADKGHLKAADNYGLLLFQQGEREAAMPYVVAAADRGDPRAQYLLGIAHFNGDLVQKDWVRAYALLTLSQSSGLPQAAGAIKQMDEYIPIEQRQDAQLVAAAIKRDSDANRAAQLAAADLGIDGPSSGTQDRPVRAIPQGSASRPPQPMQTASIAPSVARAADPVEDAKAALAEAARATGSQSPASAGAGTSVATMTPAPAPKPRTAVAAPAPASRPAAKLAASGGNWRIQLGAFGVAGNADRLWSKLSGKAALAGAKKVTEPSGRLTKLYASGYASRSEAEVACRSLKASGQDCLVTGG